MCEYCEEGRNLKKKIIYWSYTGTNFNSCLEIQGLLEHFNAKKNDANVDNDTIEKYKASRSYLEIQ